MLKTDKERVVATASSAPSSETLIVADYRGLTHKELDSAGQTPEGGSAFSGRQEHPDAPRRRRGRRRGAPRSLGGRPASPSSTTATWSRSRRRSTNGPTTRRLSLKGGVLSARDPCRRGEGACLSTAGRVRGPGARCDRRPAHGAGGARERTAAGSRRADRRARRSAEAGPRLDAPRVTAAAGD